MVLLLLVLIFFNIIKLFFVFKLINWLGFVFNIDDVLVCKVWLIFVCLFRYFLFVVIVFVVWVKVKVVRVVNVILDKFMFMFC